ncbi:MAG: hypothetical protein JXX29_08075 [Deltaproteobacteria bacterium]|nr:hypothetical protein [Deltaproteobacteria bacterium]MBN2671616.1 hypothetical protein [Deltaproteobacteria bacterium]
MSQSERSKSSPIKKIVPGTKIPIRDLVDNPHQVSAWMYRKWSPDIARIFRYERMKTLGDIVQYSKADWLDQGFTPRMLNELETALWRFGLELKEQK